MSLRELNQILLLEKGTGFEKYNKGNDSYLFRLELFLVLVISFSIHDVKRPTYFEQILTKTDVLPVLDTTSSA